MNPETISQGSGCVGSQLGGGGTVPMSHRIGAAGAERVSAPIEISVAPASA